MENLEYKNWNNFFLGLLVALLPWLGFPLTFKNALWTVLGILIALFSLARLGRRRPAEEPVLTKSLDEQS